MKLEKYEYSETFSAKTTQNISTSPGLPNVNAWQCDSYTVYQLHSLTATQCDSYTERAKQCDINTVCQLHIVAATQCVS